MYYSKYIQVRDAWKCDYSLIYISTKNTNEILIIKYFVFLQVKMIKLENLLFLKSVKWLNSDIS